MAKIKRENAEMIRGINDVISGDVKIVEFTRKGVVRGLHSPIEIKRPNQYKK
jgi:hypothetical protein